MSKDKEESEEHFNSDAPRINLDLDKEDNSEWSKYSTSIKGLKVVWYATLCGLRIEDNDTQTMMLDEDEEIKGVSYIFDNDVAICNTKCADFCLNALYGLISHTAQLGNNTDSENFNDWNNVIDGINDAILENYYNANNTFGLKPDSKNMVTAYCCSYCPYSRKARGGFMTKQATETITSIFSRMDRGELGVKKKGNWLDDILHLGKSG